MKAVLMLTIKSMYYFILYCKIIVNYSKLHELTTILNDKQQNNRRLEAQRNDLNTKVSSHELLSCNCFYNRSDYYGRSYSCYKSKALMLAK